FTGITADRVTVAAVARGHRFAVQNWLPPGPQSGNIRLVVTEPHELRLQVTGPDGKPVEGATLSELAWKTSGSDWFWFPTEVLAREKVPSPPSNRAGLMIIRGVPQDTVCKGRLRHPSLA